MGAIVLSLISAYYDLSIKGDIQHGKEALYEATTLFRRNPFENKHLIVAVLFAGIASFLVTISPFFNKVMRTAPLENSVYLLVIFSPALPTLILSGVKEVFKIKIW